MTKVLVVSSTYPANQGHKVPAFVRDQLLSIAIQDKELRFLVVSPHDTFSNEAKKTEDPQVSVYRFHYFFPRRFERLTLFGILPTLKSNKIYYGVLPFFLISEFFSILRYSKKNNVDLIYAHWFMPQGLLSVLVGQMLGVPVCFTSHSSDVEVMHRLPFGSFLVRWALRRVTRISAVSRRSHDKIREFFAKEEWAVIEKKTDIIPMGTSILPSDFPEKSLQPPLKLLSIGRLTEKKGLIYLIEAVKSLKDRGVFVELSIGGTGSLEPLLKSTVSRLSIEDRVIFHGFVSGDVKKELLETSNVFLLPSIITKDGDMEGLPVSLLEAMASGCICIATSVSGADDIICDKSNGLLIAPHSVSEIVEAVEFIASSHVKDMARISNNAKETAGQYIWPVIGEKYYKFIMAAERNDKNPSIK